MTIPHLSNNAQGWIPSHHRIHLFAQCSSPPSPRGEVKFSSDTARVAQGSNTPFQNETPDWELMGRDFTRVRDGT
jgi:hypothetical protein